MSQGTVVEFFLGGRTFADSERARENNLDIVRLLLASAVIFTHAFYLTGQLGGEPVLRFTEGRVTLGMLAVDAFFVISGYRITNSWLRGRGLADYAIKRAARIYPGYIAAILLSVLVVAPLGGAQLAEFLRDRDTWRWAVRPLLFRFAYPVEGVFEGTVSAGELNGSLWTIRFEIFCYILVAMAGVARVLKSKWWVLGAFLASLLFYRFHTGPIMVPYFDRLNQLPRFVTYFLAGATLYSWRQRVPHSLPLFILCLGVLVLSRGRGLAILWPVLLSYCLMSAGLAPRTRLATLLAGADISYGVYLYGWPIQQLLIFYGLTLSPPANAALAMPLACLAGFASWHLLEKHFLKMAKSRKATHQSLADRSMPARVPP